MYCTHQLFQIFWKLLTSLLRTLMIFHLGHFCCVTILYLNIESESDKLAQVKALVGYVSTVDCIWHHLCAKNRSIPKR